MQIFKINRLALEQRQEQFLRDRIIAVILLQDLQRMFARRVAQNDRIRLDLRRRAGVADGVDAGLEVERHGVAHDGEVLVVNGKRGLGEAACTVSPASTAINMAGFIMISQIDY